MTADLTLPTASGPAPAAAQPPAPWQAFDSAVHARLARLSGGLSPASMAAAWLDWLGHLAISPGQQQALALRALCGADALPEGAPGGPPGGATGGTPPAPDRRFAAPAWQQWPFAPLARLFQHQAAWWQQASRSVPGVSDHHARQVDFMTRQLLDMLSPSNFFWTNPEVLQATRAQGGANLLQGARHQWQDLQRLWRQPAAPGTAQAFQPGRDVAITPGQVVWRNHLIELIQYAPQTATVFAEPVLIVPPWIMKFYILDLRPEDSLVRSLVERGHTVFIISWRNPGAADHALGMDDYLQSGVMAALDVVQGVLPGRQVQALGYCLGGTLLCIAAAAMARDGDTRLKSLSLLATQVDFSEPGDLALFIDDSQLAVLDALMAEAGTLDGARMGGAFVMLHARELLWQRMVQAYLLGQDAPPSDLAAWNADTTRMPHRQHSDYLRGLYRDNDLARGRYLVDGRPVALPDIRLPVFALGTLRDTVAPWRSVYKIHLLARGDISFCLCSGGHNVGVVNPPGPGVARHYQLATHAADARYVDPDSWLASAPRHGGSWWPAWQDWLEQHATERCAPPALGHAAAGFPVLGDAPGLYVHMT